MFLHRLIETNDDNFVVDPETIPKTKKNVDNVLERRLEDDRIEAVKSIGLKQNEKELLQTWLQGIFIYCLLSFLSFYLFL